MPDVRGQAILQQRVLLALNDRAVPIVADLARLLGAHRASTSRALHALDRNGLVEHGPNGWVLTGDGATTARDQPWTIHAGERLRPAFEAICRAQMQSSGIATLLKSNWIADVRVASQLQIRMPSTSFQQIEALGQIAKAAMPDMSQLISRAVTQLESPVSIMARQLAESFTLHGALADALDSQKLGLRFVQDLPSLQLSWLRPLASESMVPAAALAADITVLDGFLATHSTVLNRTVATVIEAAGQLTTAHHLHMQTILGERVGAPQPSWTAKRVLSDVVMPTYTTARFVGATRLFMEANDPVLPEDDRRRSVSLIAPAEREARFVAILNSVHPRFVRMWHAAWHVLGSDNPDPVRLAAHEAREMLNQILVELAPDTRFGSEERVTRSMRVKFLVGIDSKSKQDWAITTARFVDETYDLLSGDAHLRAELPRFTPAMMAGILESTGGLIQTILECCQTEKGSL